MPSTKVSEKKNLDMQVVDQKPFHPKGGKRNVRASPRVEVAARLMAEAIASGNGMTGKAIMAKAGYSPGVQKQPRQVTQTLTFQQCLDKYLPMHKLTQRHEELLASADENIAVKSLDLGYRVRGHMVSKSAHLHQTIGDVAISWGE